MAEQGRLGDLDVLADKIAAACRRREALEGRVTGGEPTATLAAETLTELGTALEEVRVAVDELRQQNQELAAVRQNLAAEYQRYQELFEGIPEGYLVTDGRGCIRKANRVAGALLGLDPELLAGKPLILFLAPEDRREYWARLTDVAAASRGREWAVTVVPRGAPPFPASLTAMPLSRGVSGSPAGLRWLIRDLIGREPPTGSEPTASTGEAPSAERTDEAETPEGLAIDPTPAGRIHQLETVIASAAEITCELDLARLLERISQVAAGLFGRGAGTVYLWEEGAQVLVPHTWPGFGAWRSAVRLRLGEGVAGAVAERRDGLLVNDYLTSPFVLPIFVEHGDITAILAEPLLIQDRLLGVLIVDNTGTGRPFTQQDRETLALFAPLVAIAIQNARLVHARMPDVSRPNAPRPGPAAPGSVPVPAATSRRILVVDDDPKVREPIIALLLAAGHTVVEADSGAAAIARLADSPLDIVLTDLQMHGVTGWEVAGAAKGRRPGLPVIFLTGFVDEVRGGMERALLVDRVIEKPARIQTILAAIAELTGTSGGEER